MGRSIVAEEALETHISTLYNKDKWLIGIIIGQITAQKDYAIHLATTPKAAPETVEDEEGVAKTKTKKAVGQSLDTVEESWIVTHARQVLRMLPGGVDILGIFGMAPPEMMKSAQAKLRQVLFAIHKLDSQTNGSTSPCTDRVVLQICPLTRKLICRTFDVSDPKSSSRPADWKYQRYADQWHRLDTSMALHCVIPVHNTSLSRILEKQILQGIKPTCDNVWNSIATIDNLIAVGDRFLNPNQPQGKKAKKQQEDTTGNIYTVHLLEKKPRVSRDDVTAPCISACGAKLTLRGTMCCRAFVHSKATVDEAVKALKTDIVRSLLSRCELLCEDFLQAEEEQDPEVHYETPLRVFAPLQESSIQLCDYMFQDETNNDVVDRFKELIDLTIPEDTLETQTERIANDADFEIDWVKEVYVKTPTTPFPKLLVPLVGVVAAMLAVLIAYMYAKDSNG